MQQLIESGLKAIELRIQEPSGLDAGLTGWVINANIQINLGSAPSEATLTMANERGLYSLSDSTVNKKVTLPIGSGVFVGFIRNVEIENSEDGRIAQIVLQDERGLLANYRITTSDRSTDYHGFVDDKNAIFANAVQLGADPSLRLDGISAALIQDSNIIVALPECSNTAIQNASNNQIQTTLKEIDLILEHGATYGEIYNAINDSTKGYYNTLSGVLPTPAEVAAKMDIEQILIINEGTTLESKQEIEAVLGYIDGSGDNKIRHKFDTDTNLDDALDQIFGDLGVDWYWDGENRKIKIIARNTSVALTDSNLPGIFGSNRIRSRIGKSATTEPRVSVVFGSKRTGLLGNPLKLTNKFGSWKFFTIGPDDITIRGKFHDPLRSPGDLTFSLANQYALPYWHYTKVRYYLPGTGEKIEGLTGTQFLRDFLLRPVFPAQGVQQTSAYNISVDESSLVSYDYLVNYFNLPSTKIRYTRASGQLPESDNVRRLILEGSGWPGGASGIYFEYYPSDIELSAALQSKADWQYVVGARVAITGLDTDAGITSIADVSFGESGLSGLIIDEPTIFRLGATPVFKSVATHGTREISQSGEWIVVQDSDGSNKEKIPIWHGASVGETLRKTLQPSTNYFQNVDVTERVPLSDTYQNLDPQHIDLYLGSRPGSDAIFGRYIPVPQIVLTGYRNLTTDPDIVDIELAHDGRGVLVLAEDGTVFPIETSFPQFSYANGATLPTTELYTGNITGTYEQSVLYSGLVRSNPDGTTNTGYAWGPQFNEKAVKIKRKMGSASSDEDGYYLLFESGSVFAFGGAQNLGSFFDYTFHENNPYTETNPSQHLLAKSIAPLWAQVTKLGRPLFATGEGYSVLFSDGTIKTTGLVDFGLTGVGTSIVCANDFIKSVVSNHEEVPIDIEPSLNSKILAWNENNENATLETYVFSLWWDQNPSSEEIDGSYSIQIAGLEAGTKSRKLEFKLIGRGSHGLEDERTRNEELSINVEQLGGIGLTQFIQGIPNQHMDKTTGAFPFDRDYVWKAQLIPITNISSANRSTSNDLQGGSHAVSNEPFSFAIKPNDSERIDGSHIFARNSSWCTTSPQSDSYWTSMNLINNGDFQFKGGLRDDLVLITRDPTKSIDDENYNPVLTDLFSYNPLIYTTSGDYGFYVLTSSGGLPIVRGFGTAYRMVDQHEGTGITGQFLKAIYADTTVASSPGENKSTSVCIVGDDSDLISSFENGTRSIVDLAIPFFNSNPRPILPGPASIVRQAQYNLTRATETNAIFSTTELNIPSIYVDASGLATLCLNNLSNFPKSGLITVITTDAENERPEANQKLITLGYSGIVTDTVGPEFTPRLILSTTTDTANPHPGFPSGYFTGVPVDVQSSYADEWLLEHIILHGHGKMPDPVNNIIPEAMPITNQMIVDFVGGSGNISSIATGASSTNAAKLFSGNEIVVNWQRSSLLETVEASGVWLIDTSGRIYTVPTFENYHRVKLVDPTVGPTYISSSGTITGESSDKYQALIPSYLMGICHDYSGSNEITIKEALKLIKNIVTKNQTVNYDHNAWVNSELSYDDYLIKTFWDDILANTTNVPTVISTANITGYWSNNITRQEANDFIIWLKDIQGTATLYVPFTTTTSFKDVDNVALTTNPTNNINREDFQCAVLWNIESADPNTQDATFQIEFTNISSLPYWRDLVSSNGIANGLDNAGVVDDTVERRRYLTAQIMAFRGYWMKNLDQAKYYDAFDVTLDNSIVLFGVGGFNDIDQIVNVAEFRPVTASTSGIVHELISLTSIKGSGLPLFGHEHEDSVVDPAGMATLAAGPGLDLMNEYLNGQKVVAFTPTFGGTNLSDTNKFDEFGRLTTTSSGHILFTNKGEGYRTILPMDSAANPLSSPLGLSGIYVQNSGNIFILSNITPEVGQFTSVDIQDLNSLLDVDLNAFLYPQTLERASFSEEWYRTVKNIADQFYAKSYVIPRGLFQSGQRLQLVNGAFVDLNIEGETIPDYYRTVGISPTLQTLKLAAAAPFIETNLSLIGPHALINRAGGVKYGTSTNEEPDQDGTYYDSITFDVVPISTTEVSELNVNTLEQNYQSSVVSYINNGETWDVGTIMIQFSKPHFDTEAEFFMYNRMLYGSKTGLAIVSGVDMTSTVWTDGIEYQITGTQIIPPTGYANKGGFQFESLGLLRVPVPPSSIYFGIPVMEQARYGPFIAGETGLLTGGSTSKGQVLYEIDETLSPSNFNADDGAYNRVQKSKFAKMVRYGVTRAKSKTSTLITNDTAEVEVYGLPEIGFMDFVANRIDSVTISVDSEGPRTSYSMRSKDRIFAKEATQREKQRKEMIAQINKLKELYSYNVIKSFGVQIGGSTRQNYGNANKKIGTKEALSYEFDSDALHDLDRNL